MHKSKKPEAKKPEVHITSATSTEVRIPANVVVDIIRSAISNELQRCGLPMPVKLEEIDLYFSVESNDDGREHSGPLTDVKASYLIRAELTPPVDLKFSMVPK